MKVLFFSVLMLLSSAGYAETARAAVDRWLELIDAKDWDASWEAAAPFFKRRVSQRDWATTVENARKPLGRVRERAMLGAAYQDVLPDVPPGDYVIFQFNSVFEARELVIETLTVLLTEDGWRVSGYFIR